MGAETANNEKSVRCPGRDTEPYRRYEVQSRFEKRYLKEQVPVKLQQKVAVGALVRQV